MPSHHEILTRISMRFRAACINKTIFGPLQNCFHDNPRSRAHSEIDQRGLLRANGKVKSHAFYFANTWCPKRKLLILEFCSLSSESWLLTLYFEFVPNSNNESSQAKWKSSIASNFSGSPILYQAIRCKMKRSLHENWGQNGEQVNKRNVHGCDFQPM